MNVHEIKSVHLIGVGGINMSAVAKLLIAAGVRVSGSDMIASDQTEILASRGAAIKIGESSENIPSDCELVITTSAAPAMNKERIAAAERKIPEMTNFAFLGKWFENVQTILVTGTHGKSTTTAMLGLILEKAGLDPTVIVGSKVPSFPDGNLRIGKSDLFVIEGDEYARHFLEFHPHGVVLNNLELDHTDTFRNIDAVIASFHELVGQVEDNGIVVVNTSDPRLMRLIETEQASLEGRGCRIVKFGSGESIVKSPLSVPGAFNRMNATGAVLMAKALGASDDVTASSLQGFTGIWRRFEHLAEVREASVYSDYGHHPTAVTATLSAAHEAFPGRRVVLCFQPHHRNRTRSLFLDFVTSFDAADVLILCEIYEVAGRDEDKDKEISSRDLLEAVVRHDADRGVSRTVEYAPNPADAVKRTMEIISPKDIVIFMGAGDIDGEIRKVLVT
jgi:UDP-N-acetylmuramate--alanine ligase